MELAIFYARQASKQFGAHSLKMAMNQWSPIPDLIRDPREGNEVPKLKVDTPFLGVSYRELDNTAILNPSEPSLGRVCTESLQVVREAISRTGKRLVHK